ncbi:MAG TPA: site-2 protease family protein [Kofleriaceae bacterium]|nr:site-2 protease family protein [Kofleriaceae bacterium]
MDVSSEQIRVVITYVFVLLISVALHEFGHAIVAHKLGDDTPSRQGRVTLNPLAHADPIGTFLLPLIGGLAAAAAGGGGGGFGWGKPVQWQPSRISRRFSMSTAKILVAVAGPTMNLLLGALVAVVHVALIARGVIEPRGNVSQALTIAVQTNFVLFFFNLIPLPPLDGGHVAQSFVPYRKREAYDNFARFAPFVLLAIVMIPQIGVIFRWPADLLAHHLYDLLGTLFLH